MAISKDVRVLVISGEVVKTGEGEVFHCLAGLERVWHADLENALEMYSETAGDGWDAVIIDCEPLIFAAEIAKLVCKIQPEQPIILTHDRFNRAEEFDFGLVIPRKEAALREALEGEARAKA